MTPQQAFYKCRDNNKRDKRLEKIIIKNPQYAYMYARDVIQNRWIEAEDIISTSSCYTYRYSRDVIQGKLPEDMHNVMLLHADHYAKLYFNLIKNNPQP